MPLWEAGTNTRIPLTETTIPPLFSLGDDALEGGLLFLGRFDGFPHLHGVQALLGQGRITFHVVDADHIGLDLVADLDNVFRLDGRIVAQLGQRDITSLLGAQVDLDLGGRDGCDDTGYLISCI